MESTQQSGELDRRGLPSDLIAAIGQQASTTVYEAAGQSGAMDHGIRAIGRGMRVCGPALPIRCQPADNLTLHAAIAVARPGDVIVADVGDYCEAGHWGEILTVAAQARNVAGLVINGAVRDVAAAERRGFPVFARAVSMKATVKQVFGTIGQPVSCGGTVVRAGDLVLADEDGVVVVPQDAVAAALSGAIEREEREAGVMARLHAGELTLDVLGFRRSLEARGVMFAEGAADGR